MTIANLLALPFGAASKLRGASIFHPGGVLFDGRLTRRAPDGVGLPVHTSDVRVRASKALGSPSGWADIAGLALHLTGSPEPDQAWDILFAGAAPTSIGRIALWPNVSWNAARFSSLMPLKYDDRMWWLRARITTPIRAGMSLAAVRNTVEHSGLAITVEQACGSGRFHPLAIIHSTGLVPDDGEHPAFDPVLNSPDTVRPQPEWLRTLRLAAYRQSRAARPDTTSRTASPPPHE